MEHLFPWNNFAESEGIMTRNTFKIWEVTSPVSENKREQVSFMNKDIKSPRTGCCIPKGSDKRKQCLWAAVRCKPGVLEQFVCACVGVWEWSIGKGPNCPTSSYSVSLGRIITLLTGFPFPYKVTSFIREKETDLIHKSVLFEISLLPILRHSE